MKGASFQKTAGKTRKLLKPSKKLTHEKTGIKGEEENRIEKIKARRKEKAEAKVMNLTEEQSRRREAKFQAKKQRRLARKNPLWYGTINQGLASTTCTHCSSTRCVGRGIKPVSNTHCFLPLQASTTAPSSGKARIKVPQ